MTEEWRVPAEFPGYEVSDQGNVRSWKISPRSRQRQPYPLSPASKPDGQLIVGMYGPEGRRTVSISRLVAEAFIGPVDDKEVYHLNGDAGDNRVDNLAIGTRLDTMRVMVANGHSTKGRSHTGSPAKCGTPSGYNRHRRLGETTCAECRKSVLRKNRKPRERDHGKLLADYVSSEGMQMSLSRNQYGTSEGHRRRGQQDRRSRLEHDAAAAAIRAAFKEKIAKTRFVPQVEPVEDDDNE